MTKTILPWLLHHANREGRNEHFYKIKNKILSKYGKHVCYDVQFIEGKKCFSCGGTGVYVGYRWNGDQYFDHCYHCFNGWYKQPIWNILQRIQFGKYIFHQPYQRLYKKPEIETQMIEGYIDHNRSKYGKFALNILFLIYEKGYLKRYWKESGNGWRIYWWRPSNWIYNSIHIIKKRGNSIPVKLLKRKFSKSYNVVKMQKLNDEDFVPCKQGDDLPF